MPFGFGKHTVEDAALKLHELQLPAEVVLLEDASVSIKVQLLKEVTTLSTDPDAAEGEEEAPVRLAPPRRIFALSPLPPSECQRRFPHTLPFHVAATDADVDDDDDTVVVAAPDTGDADSASASAESSSVYDASAAEY